MQKIILGKLKRQPQLRSVVTRAFDEAKRVLHMHDVFIKDDMTFLLQRQVDSSLGAEYERHRNVVIFFLSQLTFVSVETMTWLIIKSAIEQVFDAKRCGQGFSSEFLRDLYRSGVGAYWAQTNFSRGILPLNDRMQGTKLLNEVADVVAGETEYDAGFWYAADERVVCPAWWLGEQFVRQLVESQNLLPFTLTQNDFERLIAGR